MSKFSNFLTGLLSGMIESAGESKLIEILQELHDKNPAQYKAAIYGGTALVQGLLPLVTGTPNKIDDAILNAIDDAIRISAERNGINPLAKQVEDTPNNIDA